MTACIPILCLTTCCMTHAVTLARQWTTAIDKRLVNGVVLLDLRKDFDLVNHTVLLEKFAVYGCTQQSMRWFSLHLFTVHERQAHVHKNKSNVDMYADDSTISSAARMYRKSNRC